MKKRTLIAINIIVCLIIFTGFVVINLLHNDNFNKIVENDIENISKLSSSTIYGQIDNSLTKPIFVGQTMANDTFLKNWLNKENPNEVQLEQQQLIQEYLSAYQNKYNYDSVFLVSANSEVYYHYEGINKIVSPENPHDIWYYDFLESNKPYDLDVDADEVKNNQLTIFVNCRIEGSDGSLLGVVGVGVKMDHLQGLLKSFENDYDLNACLINNQGVVQIDSDVKNIETANFFDNKASLALKDKILNKKQSMEIFWYPNGAVENCVITQYVENLDWYIVIHKDTSTIRSMLTTQFKKDLLLIAIIIVMVLLLSSFLICRYNRLLVKTAATDEVTNLPNMKMFHEIYRRNSKKNGCKEGTLFIFDIDHFKKVNDLYGHMFGNTVLYQISSMANQVIGNKGIIARFGGDEFVGAIYAPPDEADVILKDIIAKVCKSPQMEDIARITISIGATRIVSGNKLDALIKEADVALYRSKTKGRNQVTYYE
ncbi:MAG: diguanylate cyclase [Clostridiales bacterium]